MLFSRHQQVAIPSRAANTALFCFHYSLPLLYLSKRGRDSRAHKTATLSNNQTMNFHHCTIQEISSHLNHLFNSTEHTDLIQKKINELLRELHKCFNSESRPKNIALDYSGGGCWTYKNIYICGAWDCEHEIWTYKVEIFQPDCQAWEGFYESYHLTFSGAIHQIDWITDKNIWMIPSSS